jgi:hypothetical protein
MMAATAGCHRRDVLGYAARGGGKASWRVCLQFDGGIAVGVERLDVPQEDLAAGGLSWHGGHEGNGPEHLRRVIGDRGVQRALACEEPAGVLGCGAEQGGQRVRRGARSYRASSIRAASDRGNLQPVTVQVRRILARGGRPIADGVTGSGCRRK